MYTDHITGPGLIVDNTKCLSNLERMVQKLRKHNISFRPHFKTHQSRAIGRWFRTAGVDKITVSSLRMAYYFADDHWNDILVGIAYNPREYSLYEKLAERCRLQATVACTDTARILAEQCRFPLEVMIKTDTGYNRSGIRWNDTDDMRACIKYLASNSNLRIRGLMTHDGSTYGLNDKKLILDHYNISVSRINQCRDKTGISDLIISAGDTPSASLAGSFEGIDEMRPGNFIFYDLMQYINGSCEFDDIAVSMYCPVIDIRRRAETIVIHGGAVHFSKDSVLINGKSVYGMLAGINDKGWSKPEKPVYVSALSQEHGIIDCSDNNLIETVKPGDLLPVIPVHSCLTADCTGSYLTTGSEVIDHMKGSAGY
ncbi:MAG: alanine racemase [Bacteroidales bacterium]|nr:alanine racemase [Bacteroidales bacterium]